MIMNNYAQNNLQVELVIPEPFKSNALVTYSGLIRILNLQK